MCEDPNPEVDNACLISRQTKPNYYFEMDTQNR